MRVLNRFDGFVARRTHRAADVYRWGLGLVILLAGAHKLVEPGVWSAYAAPWAHHLWPLAMDPTMVANGVIEVGFGVAILGDRYTTLAAAVVAVSLLGVLVNLVAVGIASGEFVDVAIRDVGLLALAVGVTLQSAPGSTAGDEGSERSSPTV